MPLWVDPNSPRANPCRTVPSLVGSLLEPAADDLSDNELRRESGWVGFRLVRVGRVLPGLEEGTAGVDASGRLNHLGKIRWVVPEGIRDVFLDINHGLMKDGPNNQVNQLSAHPVVVTGPNRKREDVPCNKSLDDEQDLDH